ncbi:HesB/IscA family protein [Brevibacillus sp. B_LB10_24]|uniref:HesB/IscA family protein n=1 Tax=Brevibacillus sp. B_LB10_24 TaxID=3380645 RepID=UPI0038B7814B
MITITPLAAARLALTIADEPDADRLGIRIVMTTTGCSSVSYSIAITERSAGEQTATFSGIRVFYREEDLPLLTGLVIDLNRTNGRLQLFHPNPPNNCPLS